MLVEFSVGNFRSFKDPVTFSMVAARITAQNKVLNQDNLFQLENLSLLKSAAIYGANASGKSNLIAAFGFMRKFVLDSTDSNSEDKIGVEPFLLSTDTIEQPSYFEVTFQIDETRYRYGFEVLAATVRAEWLFRTKTRESELFWREDDKIEVKSGFKEGRGLEERTRDNALFLSVSDQWNGEIARQIIKWFTQVNIISGIDDKRYLGFTVSKLLENDSIQHKIREFIQTMDLGVSGVSVEITNGTSDASKEPYKLLIGPEFPTEISDAFGKEVNPLDGISDAFGREITWSTPSVKLSHQQLDESDNQVKHVEFNFDEQESEGTKKAFALSGPILHTLQEGQVLFVDELDARLHPLITRYIIKLFNSRVTNPHNAQLIFVTHDTNLLSKEIFRRDQIWFTEKNRFGSTDLYSLVEYKIQSKGIRNDASYEADYIAGRYGAIPFIGGVSFLIEEDDGKA
ncbi:MAG: ATP-binding protein [Chloroflexota bacterium]